VRRVDPRERSSESQSKFRESPMAKKSAHLLMELKEVERHERDLKQTTLPQYLHVRSATIICSLTNIPN